MSDLKLNGLGVAIVTPFKKDLSIDYDSLEKLIKHVIIGGCDYIVVLGTTAETPTLTKEEKIIITEFVKEKSENKVPLVIGIGGNSTKAVCDEISQARLDGYSAILSVTPYYNRPSQRGLYEHFKAISENSPLPIILYNVPSRTGVNLSAKTTIELSNLGTKICGIKEASGNLLQCEEIAKNAPSDFILISGDDSATCNMMKIGARGVISVLANAYPKLAKRIVERCIDKKFEEADKYLDSVKCMITLLFEEGNPAGIKAALSNLGIIENVLRLPLMTVSKTTEEKIKKAAAILQNLE